MPDHDSASDTTKKTPTLAELDKRPTAGSGDKLLAIARDAEAARIADAYRREGWTVYLAPTSEGTLCLWGAVTPPSPAADAAKTAAGAAQRAEWQKFAGRVVDLIDATAAHYEALEAYAEAIARDLPGVDEARLNVDRTIPIMYSLLARLGFPPDSDVHLGVITEPHALARSWYQTRLNTRPDRDRAIESWAAFAGRRAQLRVCMTAWQESARTGDRNIGRGATLALGVCA